MLDHNEVARASHKLWSNLVLQRDCCGESRLESGEAYMNNLRFVSKMGSIWRPHSGVAKSKVWQKFMRSVDNFVVIKHDRSLLQQLGI